MPLKLFLAVSLALLAGNAAADLYRWVDPATGSVKFSNYPPPWYGDPALERDAPKVERIQERSTPPTASSSASEPAAAPPAPPPPGKLEALEAQRKAMLQQLSTLPPRRSSASLKQQLDAFGTVGAELDRLDPGGAERRRAEAKPVLDKLVDGVRAQMKPPPQQ